MTQSLPVSSPGPVSPFKSLIVTAIGNLQQICDVLI